MRLSFLPGYRAVKPNLSVYFGAQGGTAPYVFSVKAGGIGGTINASSGLYTSPSITGLELLKVTDAVGDSAFAEVLVGSPLQLICDIIQVEMGLKKSQVFLWDQKYNVPNNEVLYVAVGVVSCKPFANNIRSDGSGSGLSAVQSTNFYSLVSIQIESRDSSALDRKEELVMALRSQYAQRQQELNSFFIGNLPSNFVNLSEIDGAAIPYQFNISVGVQYFISKTKPVEYYDTFETTEVVVDP